MREIRGEGGRPAGPRGVRAGGEGWEGSVPSPLPEGLPPGMDGRGGSGTFPRRCGGGGGDRDQTLPSGSSGGPAHRRPPPTTTQAPGSAWPSAWGPHPTLIAASHRPGGRLRLRTRALEGWWGGAGCVRGGRHDDGKTCGNCAKKSQIMRNCAGKCDYAELCGKNAIMRNYAGTREKKRTS